jgi:uncharacterized membrane protein
MMRWLGWIVGGLLLGAAAHLATVLWLPATATRNSFSRLAPVTVANQVSLLPQPSPSDPLLPFVDPAFATAVCRYDLSAGILKVRMPVTQTYGSLTFYTRAGTAFYAINDRAAGRRLVELDLMTQQQRAMIEEDEEVTAADRLIVQTPEPTGLIVMRALAPEPGAMPMARGVLSGAQCAIQPPQG